MSRPWIITPKGQRVTLLASFILSAVAIIPVVNQFALDEHRKLISELTPGEVSYCELSGCDEISGLAGLQIVPGIEQLVENEYGVQFKIRVVNGDQLVGTREVWAELRTQSGERIESLRGLLTLSKKGPQFIEFYFTGTTEELTQNLLFLGF
jgi:hypothetical protein